MTGVKFEHSCFELLITSHDKSVAGHTRTYTSYFALVIEKCYSIQLVKAAIFIFICTDSNCLNITCLSYVFVKALILLLVVIAVVVAVNTFVVIGSSSALSRHYTHAVTVTACGSVSSVIIVTNLSSSLFHQFNMPRSFFFSCRIVTSVFICLHRCRLHWTHLNVTHVPVSLSLGEIYHSKNY